MHLAIQFLTILKTNALRGFRIGEARYFAA
jgi:hypothetical protein